MPTRLLEWSQWTAGGVLERGLNMERANLQSFLEQSTKAAATKRVVILGDVNADALRVNDSGYSRRAVLNELQAGLDCLGFKYHPTGPTWKSSGRFKPRLGVDADVATHTHTLTPLH
jgi:hypothetical protein